MNQQLPIENKFISTLTDQLNEEIVLATIQNAEEVVGNLSAWLQDFGISRELSGYENLTKQQIDETQIIVFQYHGSEKGHVLEIMVSRMRRISSHIET